MGCFGLNRVENLHFRHFGSLDISLNRQRKRFLIYTGTVVFLVFDTFTIEK